MTPAQHVLASGVTSAAFYAVSHSVSGTTICFLSGVFIDIDHIVDLFIYKKKLLLSVKDLFDFCEREKGGKLYLIFHSYELLMLLWISIFAFHLNAAWWGLAIGVSVHMFLDQLANPVRPWVYFLWYRAKGHFAKEWIFKPAYFNTMDL